MSLWTWILVASVACFALKYAGNVIPSRVLTNQRFAQVAALVTVGLLAAMVTVQTFGGTRGLVVDARIASLAVAAVALMLRAPFVLVVFLGALVAAGVRLLGWG